VIPVRPRASGVSAQIKKVVSTLELVFYALRGGLCVVRVVETWGV